MTGGPIWVVAGALRVLGSARQGVSGLGTGGVSKDTWLMQCRPLEKHHGGLWEFPGGKVEDAEMPVKALIRELHEELGIMVNPGDCIPAGFAEEHAGRTRDEIGGAGAQASGQEVGAVAAPNPRSAIVILLYTIDVWAGEPRALEGGRIGMFTADEIRLLDKPPLDQELAARLFEKG